MPAMSSQASDRRAAKLRAYLLVRDIQADVPEAAAELGALAIRAEALGWDEVARVALFGSVVRAWYLKEGDVGSAVAALLERSTRDGDPAMLALGLALRADLVGPGEDPTARDADLARAVVLLEHSDADLAARVTAHTAAGIAFGSRGLFELGDEQYAAALAVGAEEEPGTIDFLLSPVTFNRAEVQVAWASTLFQLGDREGVEERWRSWLALSAAAASREIPDAWRAELGALGLLLGAMAGDDTAARASALLADASVSFASATRAVGLARLAGALSDAAAHRLGAEVAARAAIDSLDASLHPQIYDLALYLAAELEARDGRRAGLDYARRQLLERWTVRTGALGAMRSRVEAERQATEREQLTRHARLDDLTGIGNRRALEHYLDGLGRLGISSVALILLDVDDFKMVNDRFGHLAGDAVLIGIAQALERSIRPCDLAVRLGGDEFAVVLADADLDAAFERAASFLAVISELRFDSTTPELAVALSAGVAAGAPAQMSQLRAEADVALYRAKDGGGHRVLASRLARAVA